MARHASEKGATAVIVASALILLFGMAAIAIDLGAGFDERRQDQLAADASSLAGAVSTIDGQGLSIIVSDIQANASTNLDGRSIDWASCQDPDHLGGLTSAQNSSLGLDAAQPCISFGTNSDGVALARIRVRIPDQAQETTFARVIGSAFINVNAEAEVELEGERLYRNFPSMVFSGAGPGEEFCVRSSPGNASPTPSEDCEGSSTGNFGLFLPYFYTNIGGWFCDSGNSSSQSAYAIAEGLDHLLAANPALANAQLENGTECPQTGGPLNPNQIRFTSGNDPNITRGLITGSSGSPPLPLSFQGRLAQRVWDTSTYGSAQVFGISIDNRPLYTYIDTGVAGLPTVCADAATGPSQVTATNEAQFLAAMSDLAACLSGSPPDNLFLPAIYDTPRLTTVPKLHQNAPCGNISCLYDIDTFLPIFINSVYTDDLGTCDGTMVEDTTNGFCRHDPGRTGSITDNAPGQRVLKSATAILLTCDVLPPPGTGEEKCKNIGSGSNATTTFLRASLVK